MYIVFSNFNNVERVPLDTASRSAARVPTKFSSSCKTLAESQSLRLIFPKVADFSGRSQGGAGWRIDPPRLPPSTIGPTYPTTPSPCDSALLDTV